MERSIQQRTAGRKIVPAIKSKLKPKPKVKKSPKRKPKTKIQKAEALIEKLKLEAQIHAVESDTQKSSLLECYRAIGSPLADWNGATPVIDYVERQAKRTAELEAQLKEFRLWGVQLSMTHRHLVPDFLLGSEQKSIDTPLKVFPLNEYEWWIAETYSQALKAAAKNYGCDESQFEPDNSPLTEEELHKYSIAGRGSFMDEFRRVIESGVQDPKLFAVVRI